MIVYNLIMEIEELDVEISENQISFDFLNEQVPQVLQNTESVEWVAEETLVVLVKAKKEISSNFEILGKKMIDWVALAASGCQQKVIDEPTEEDLLEKIKPLCEGFKFVAVLYSDTPLLKKSTFLDIMKYFSSHRMNVLKLSRGFVFKSEFLQTAKIMLSTSVEEFDKEDFSLIDTTKSVSYAFNVLKSRILNYHKNQGVVFFGEETIFIDADVEIEAGTVVYPNNVIKGESYIGKNVILESGNYIFDTIICDEAFVCQSYLEKSKVEIGKTVGPFERLINQKI